ncbi:HEAT repeat-containing protein 4 [Chiloscyllium plagiosum]|uniref:HEAT repeat-containing protein 4 n=1 Tax=Chiloscyllium plagiosum TaxID=36176 RepID=UPI001CB7BA8C|nr:HEAT repeat-containing protein 4 [Chiloscyllium plagiosum]
MDLPTLQPPATSQNWKTILPPQRKYRQQLHRQYIKDASLNLKFSQDVVNSMLFYQVPFKERDGRNMFNLFEVVAREGVKDHAPRRPGHLKRVSRHPKTLRQVPKREAKGEGAALVTDRSDQRLTASHLHKGASSAEMIPSSESSSPVAGALKVPALEQSGDIPERAAKDSTSELRETWDEYLVKKVSKRMAQWLVTKQMPRGPSRARLGGLLQDHYGSAHTHALIEDETMTPSDFLLYDQIKVQEPIVTTVRKETKTPLTAYYRVPGFDLNEGMEEPGSVNRTAANLKVKHFESPPKPKTILNSKLGKHVYYTENVFEQELYTGSSSVVYHCGEKYKERIIMDNLSEYQKHLQERFPKPPEEWLEDKGDKDKQQVPPGSKRVSKGLRRWTGLPTLADYTMEQGLRLPDYELVEKKVKKSFKMQEDLQVMRNMVTGWIKAWHIYSHWQDITIEELKRDLKAIHSYVQLSALATCASGAIERPQLEEDKDRINLHLRNVSEVQAVPESLQPLISEALNSSNKHVQLAAAICHVTMEKVNDRVLEILRDNLLHGNSADCWIAAQSLALNGDDSYPVVSRIIQHLFNKPEPEIMKQVCLILGPLSERTTLAHFILAKHLNSRNWQEKVLACKVFSCLRGSLNKDLTRKIVHLMWNDWNSDVRQAATHSLGALGLGKEAHDKLREILEKGDCRSRIEALSCIGQLGVMTGKLMPSFLACFSDDFVGVRREACLTAGLLKIKDEQVLHHLVRLMQSDHIWKIKAYAIKALGAIGHVTEQLKNLLLWALHYEQEPGIRMEACNSIVSLNLNDAHVQNVLREQLLVEPDPLVREDVRLALQRLGGSSEVTEGMLPKIKQQINTLCQKDVVIWKLLRLEMVKLDIAQQIQWINLKRQPEHLTALREQIEHLNKSVIAPRLPSTEINFEDKECEAEIESVLDSSTPAALQLTKENQLVRCQRNGEWQTLTEEELHYSRALREGKL